MKLANGDVIRLSSRQIRVDSFLSAGTEGQVYKVTDVKTRENGALKVFNNHMAPGDRLQRINYLVNQHLDTACPSLCPPTDALSASGLVGHYSPFVVGHTLEEHMGLLDNSIFENHKLAIAIAQSMSIMHDQNMAHGDIHLNNFIIVPTPQGPELKTIDFDNYSKPGLPIPAMVGHDLFMAPELREAVAAKTVVIPDIYSDRFALAGLLHVVLLCKHLASGADADPAQLDHAMNSGVWIQDPIRSRNNGDGYPATILNADLMRLFRRAVSREPSERPSAREWVKVLHDTFFQIYIHDACGGPVYVDPSKTTCPFCNQLYGGLKLVFPSSKREIPIVSAAVPVGRKDLQSQKVSARHVVCRRIGPETYLEPAGRNGTFRWDGTAWLRLPDNKPVLIQKNDRLRIADIECLVDNSNN